MNKLFYLLIAVVLFSSCGSDVTFNNPTFQGEIENVFWRADQYQLGTSDDGSLIITGIGNGQVVSLKVPDIGTANYTISPQTNIVAAEYIVGDITTGNTILYSTIGVGEGFINITEAGPEGFSGEFGFRAYNGVNAVSISFGTFYRIQPNIANPTLVSESCDYITGLVNTARATFNATPPNSDEYPAACAAYVNALQDQITYCGDPDGTIVDTIIILGDCQGANGNGTFTVNINGEDKVYDIIYVEQSGQFLQVRGEITGTNDTIDLRFDSSIDPSIGNCTPPPGDANCGVDVLRDVRIQYNGVIYTDADPSFPYFPDPNDPNATPSYFLGNLVTNAGNAFSGTLNGRLFEGGNANNGFITISNGIIDLTY